MLQHGPTVPGVVPGHVLESCTYSSISAACYVIVAPPQLPGQAWNLLLACKSAGVRLPACLPVVSHLQGTTYYVPQFSTFVCTPCSGVQ